jgi:antitoxin VapB
MGSQMNIKSEEAYALASELAGLEGVSLTQAVLEALRARKRELARANMVEEAMAIAREMRSRMSAETLALDIDEYLYDEHGLPR